MPARDAPGGAHAPPPFFSSPQVPRKETSLYYPISEYEVYRIKDCMHQMGLVIDLCCMAGPDQQLSDLGGLMSFLTAQQRALRGTLQTVQARKATPGPACDPDPGGRSGQLLVEEGHRTAARLQGAGLGAGSA